MRSNHLSYKPKAEIRVYDGLTSQFWSTSLESLRDTPLKGGDPAAPSGTATLLRLRPSYQSYLNELPPEGWATRFGYY